MSQKTIYGGRGPRRNCRYRHRRYGCLRSVRRACLRTLPTTMASPSSSTFPLLLPLITAFTLHFFEPSSTVPHSLEETPRERACLTSPQTSDATVTVVIAAAATIMPRRRYPSYMRSWKCPTRAVSDTFTNSRRAVATHLGSSWTDVGIELLYHYALIRCIVSKKEGQHLHHTCTC